MTIERWLRPAALAFVLLLAGCASGGGAADPPKSGWASHYRMARIYYEQGRKTDALAEIDRALRADRDVAHVWFYRGYIHWSMEKWEDAESDFRQALRINESYTDARMYLAAVRDQQGDPAGALAELDRALKDQQFQTPEKIHVTKSRIHRRQGRTDDALASLREAVLLKPRYYDAHYDMATLLVELGRLGEAEAAFRAAEPGFTKDAGFRLAYGETLFKLRRPDDAARELRRAVELAPGSEPAAKASELLRTIG